MLAEMEAQDSYITASMATDGNSLRGRVRIPATQIQPIMMLFMVAEQQQGGGRIQIEAVPAN
jgi:hypothetical protein